MFFSNNFSLSDIIIVQGHLIQLLGWADSWSCVTSYITQSIIGPQGEQGVGKVGAKGDTGPQGKNIVTLTSDQIFELQDSIGINEDETLVSRLLSMCEDKEAYEFEFTTLTDFIDSTFSWQTVDSIIIDGYLFKLIIEDDLVINYEAHSLIGPQGPVGNGINILGSFDDAEELYSQGLQGQSGDAYLINGELYVWDGTDWSNVGSIQGPQGEEGPQGIRGEKGNPGETGKGFVYVEGRPYDSDFQNPTIANEIKSAVSIREGDYTISAEGTMWVCTTDGFTQGVSLKGPQGAKGSNGANGTSVKISKITQSTEPGGVSKVSFSDGNTLNIYNGHDAGGQTSVSIENGDPFLKLTNNIDQTYTQYVENTGVPMNAGHIDFQRSDLHSNYTARIMNEVTYTRSDSLTGLSQYESTIVMSGNPDGWQTITSDASTPITPDQYQINPFKLKVLGNIECSQQTTNNLFTSSWDADNYTIITSPGDHTLTTNKVYIYRDNVTDTEWYTLNYREEIEGTLRIISHTGPWFVKVILKTSSSTPIDVVIRIPSPWLGGDYIKIIETQISKTCPLRAGFTMWLAGNEHCAIGNYSSHTANNLPIPILVL